MSSQPDPAGPVAATHRPLDVALDRLAVDACSGVTIIGGFPASGKSTASAHLAAVVNAIILDKDTFAAGLEAAVMAELTGNPYDRDSDTYARVVKPHIYAAVIHQALLAGQRVPVIVDAPFIGQIRSAAQERLSLADYLTRTERIAVPAVRTIWISAPPNQIHDRMTTRNEPRDAPKLCDWDAYRSEVLDSGVDAQARSVVDHVIENN
ncbi:AAA family ATPase [Nocardia sp. NPDC059240]|uniref:AAA family ATPase n=1 Tax=Nocardia sp. NPDC059240 TaxID=3346786 RepID=UPI0036B090B2